jgi:quaternary ammonium compound-resistance protein SugE
VAGKTGRIKGIHEVKRGCEPTLAASYNTRKDDLPSSLIPGSDSRTGVRCLSDAFSSREPVSTSLENALVSAGTTLPVFQGRFVMAWFMLFVAGLMEVGWAIGLKYTDGFTRLVPSILTLAAMAASLALLGLVLKTLPIGTAYAVWTGIGAVGTAILGIVLFGDPATMARLVCIGLIVAGIAGLKLVT